MKVLVTGATGFIGKQLLLLLRDRGHEVVVLTRQPDKACVRLPILCRVFSWDGSFLEPPQEAFQEVSAVVHLAGENFIGRWTRARKEELRRSRLLSTRQLVQALQGLEKKPQVLVCASGVGYYGDQPSAELDESAPPGADILADLCRQWEAEAVLADTLRFNWPRLPSPENYLKPFCKGLIVYGFCRNQGNQSDRRKIVVTI